MTNGTARGAIQLEIDPDLCLVCGSCEARQVCRGSAIRIIDRGEAPYLDMSRCWGCQVCIVVCPGGAIVHHDVPAP